MCAQLIMIVVVIAFDGGVFDRPVYALDLAVGPWMAGPGQPVFNPVGVADHVKAHGPGIDRVSVPWLRGEPDAIIGQDRVDVIRNGFEQMFKELPGCLAVGLVYELSDANLPVRSMAANSYSLPSAVWTSAMYMWKPPIG